MNKLFAILVILTSTTWLTAQGGEVMLDRVVAQVGSEIILLSDVEERVAQAKEQQGAIPEGIRCQIIESVMLGKLMVNQAKLDSIEVSDQMVDANLDQRFDYIMNLFNNDPEQFRAYYGRGIDEMREFMRAELKDDMIMQEMRRKITSEIQITPKEVTEFYNAIPKDSLPYFNSEVEISELVYVPSANEEAKQEATDKLNEIKDRIKGGESFEELAQIYSDDFGSARNGGSLGWMKRGSLVPEYEAVAYNMEPNELSDVTESEFGFHLIQLLERRGNSILTRHILVRPQITEYDLNAARELLDSIKRAVMQDSLPFEEAVKKFSHDKVQSYYNGGRVTNQATGNTFFEIADLDPETFFAIDTLLVGEVAGPVEIVDEAGEVTFKLFKLDSRTDPHVANLRQDYTKIQEAAVNKKRAKVFDEWANEVINSTYIEVIPEYSDCPNLKSWLDRSN